MPRSRRGTAERRAPAVNSAFPERTGAVTPECVANLRVESRERLTPVRSRPLYDLRLHLLFSEGLLWQATRPPSPETRPPVALGCEGGRQSTLALACPPALEPECPWPPRAPESLGASAPFRQPISTDRARNRPGVHVRTPDGGATRCATRLVVRLTPLPAPRRRATPPPVQSAGPARQRAPTTGGGADGQASGAL